MLSPFRRFAAVAALHKRYNERVDGRSIQPHGRCRTFFTAEGSGLSFLMQNSSLSKTFQEAAMALRAKDFARAEKLASKILRSSRTDRDATLILAHALFGQNRPEEAVQPLERAARRQGDAEIETMLGAALCNARRGDEGISMLRQITLRRPPHLPSFQELAGQLAKAGQFDEAVSIIENALALAPGNIDLQLDLGRLLLKNNAPAMASDVLAAARDHAPGRADIAAELGRALLLAGNYPAAADAYRLALGLRPDDVLSRANLAACLLEMNQREAAESSLRAIMRTRPDMLGRVTYAMTAASHGRCFFSLNAAAEFLKANDR